MECMMSFSCEKCNYNTPHKQNYDRHLQTAKHLETYKQDIEYFSCDLCKYSTQDKSNYDRHLKSLKHFHRTRPTEQEIMHKMAKLWGKYVSRKTPEEDERECMFQYFERNWEEMVCDNVVSSRPKQQYTSKEDFDEIWKTVNTSIVPCEERIEEV